MNALASRLMDIKKIVGVFTVLHHRLVTRHIYAVLLIIFLATWLISITVYVPGSAIFYNLSIRDIDTEIEDFYIFFHLLCATGQIKPAENCYPFLF